MILILVLLATVIALLRLLLYKKRAKVNINLDEVGDYAGFEDFYNIEPDDIIILENQLWIKEKIDTKIS